LNTFVLQIHYTNPDLVNDIVDSTGLVFELTSNLRKFDIGTFTVGGTLSWQSMALVLFEIYD
jgi:hypothetical protein